MLHYKKVDADRIRELASRRESPQLDFKRESYSGTTEGILELTKDLIAMANSLSPASGPAYILVGVNEEADGTGTIVGISTVHERDSNLQQKVRSHINRSPDFSYYPVDVDGLSVGVFEIRPSRRPFFALRDHGRLSIPRFGALYRRGTSTDLADPEMIIQWAREDSTWLQAQGLPDIELRGAHAACTTRQISGDNSTSRTIHAWNLHADIYIIPATDATLYIPFHHCKSLVIWPGGTLECSVAFAMAQSASYAMLHSDDISNESANASVSGSTLTLKGPALVRMICTFEIDKKPSGTPQWHVTVQPTRSQQSIPVIVSFEECTKEHRSGDSVHFHLAKTPGDAGHADQ